MTLIECPLCGGHGCEKCDNGQFQLCECPYEYIGGDMVETFNLASMCGKGDWPVSGGLLDQSSWFLKVVHMLRNDIANIENEKLEQR